MKEDINKKRTLYLCNPKLNIKCKKSTCQKQCKWTKNKEYAQLKDGEPVIKW